MTKTEQLRDRLASGWAAVPDLCKEFGWKPNTLRAQICAIKGSRIERLREAGITSYRIGQPDEDDGQPTEQQEWHDYDPHA